MSETQTVALEQEPFHERLTDERLGELLAAFGNHEGKATLIIAMANLGREAYLTSEKLYGELENYTGTEEVYLGSSRNQGDWCSDSLVPIGLVAKADYGSPLSYAISEEGITYGKPLAGLLLDFADRHNVPLLHLFGATRSRAQRSPALRFKMISEIITHPGGLTESELVKSIDTNHGTPGAILLNLSAAKLVNYQPWDMSKDTVQFELADENYKPDGRAGEIGLAVMNYMKAHTSASLDQIFVGLKDQLKATFPDKTEQELRQKLNLSLIGFKKRGVLAGRGRAHKGDIQVSMTAGQEIMWTDLLERLDKFQNQNPGFIAECSELADNYLHDPKKVATALNRSAEASPQAQNGSEKNPEELIRKVLSNHAGAISVRDVVELIATQEGRQLSQWGIRSALQRMVSKELVKVDGNKSRVYKLVEKPASKD